MEVTDGAERILDVVEESKAQHQIERAERANRGVLDIRGFKGNRREAPARFSDILGPAIESSDGKLHVGKHPRKEADTAPDIESGREAEERPELVRYRAQRGAAHSDELE